VFNFLRMIEILNENMLKSSGVRIEDFGYSSEIIQHYEKKLSITFPKSYLEFLSQAGNLFSEVMSFNSVGIDRLERNKERLLQRMSEVKKVKFEFLRPICVFRFDFSGDYCYFFCDEDENPYIYRTDDIDVHRNLEVRFLDFIENDLYLVTDPEKHNRYW
jgi:hypothetical protein